MSTKKQLKTLSFEQKIELVNSWESKSKTRKELSVQYGCDLSTITRIIGQKEKIKEIALKNGNVSRKRLRNGPYHEINEAVAVWFRQMRAKDVRISGKMIEEVARQFAHQLGYHNFEPSKGWLQRWKDKENVSFHRMHGEKGAADQTGADNWIKNTMPSLLDEHNACDIYNADESGLFYKALPNGTMARKGEKVEGGKMSKDRLSLLFLCNMDGSDKQIFVIDKSEQSRCFRGKTIPLPYYSNKKAWMTGTLWTQILIKFDNQMIRQDRKVLLFVDNASCHKLDKGVELQNVKIYFLPANTTSIIQPLDQGIIRAFKAHYLQKIVLQQLTAVDQNLSMQQFTKEITVLEALKFIKLSWCLVTPLTIQNCFRKAGFAKTVEEGRGPEIEEGWEPEVEEGKEPEVEESILIQLEMSKEEFYDYIEHDMTLDCYGELTVEDIANEIQEKSDHDEEEEPEVEQVKPPPSRTDALAALNVLRAFLDDANEIEDLKLMDALEKRVYNTNMKYIVQTKILDYFKKT